jgi:hypothetical protein
MPMYKVLERLTTPISLIKQERVKDGGYTEIKESESSEILWCSWKSYGGTESDIDGLSLFQDTAKIECRYHPQIKQNDIVKNLLTNKKYQIISVPDDINQLHQYLQFKVKRLAG